MTRGDDFFFEMDDHSNPTLTEGQFRAAQMLIARLLAEGEGRPFEFAEVGLQWDMPDTALCAHYEDGTLLSVGDVMYGAIVLLWSTLIERAELADESILESISRLGLGLAMHNPS